MSLITRPKYIDTPPPPAGTGGGAPPPPFEAKQIEQKRAYAYVEGMMFDRWIDTVSGSARSNGYNENDLIENIGYCIESLYRDYIFVEYDLIVTSITSGTVFICDELKSSKDDYYNFSIIRNMTTGGKGYVSDYVGSTKTLTIIGTTVSAADDFVLSNVQGDNRINIASFDALGNTTDGSRDNWDIRFTLDKKISVDDLIDQLCFEGHLIKTESYDQIKLFAMDSDSAIATWGSPLKQNGVELAGAKLSDIENVYTDFRIKYAFDYGKKEYTKEYFVNRNGFTTGSSLTTEKTLCGNAEDNYLVKNVFEYNSDYIYNDATARSLIQKLVLWFTKQRLQPIWFGSVKNFIQYEIGDIIKINYAVMIPTGLNNSTAFMIYSKEINTKKKIALSFIEL